MRILLCGGGTGGSVTPLLAIAQQLREKDPKIEFLFLGTKKKHPERELAQGAGIPFRSIYAGKLRRYFSLKNIFDPIFVIFGIFQSFFILLKFRPNVVLSAGSFVAVPVVFSARILGIPCFIHQQDVVQGLANRLMGHLATKITVALRDSTKSFPLSIVIYTGNPIRMEILSAQKEESINFFHFTKETPTVLVLGGGTGSVKLNQILDKALPNLIKFCQVIHLTGGRKGAENKNFPRYRTYEFLSQEMKYAYAAADLVISRAGMGVITELAALAKPAILIPLFKSHQEKNAQFFEKNKAVLVIRENVLTPELLIETASKLLSRKEEMQELGRNIHQFAKLDAAEKIAEEVLRFKK